jgi:hypothetical protein
MATSSNAVRVTAIPETTYGITPVAGNFDTVRFTSEELSASPDTVESQQIRVDRMSSGQVVTGLSVQGGLNFELCKDATFDKFLESAMFNTWDTKTLQSVNITIDINTTNTATRSTGSWITDGIAVGDFITFSSFTNSVNNVQVMVTSVVSATVINFIGPASMVDETGTGTGYKRADKLVIGTTKKSFSIEKAFTDMTTKALIYKGSVVGELSLSLRFGELATGSMTLYANNYINADAAGEFITNGRTINPATTTNTMNGSIDMPFIATNALGSFSTSGMDVEGLEIKLNNNLNPQNVIGAIAPRDYTAGTCQVEVSLNTYLTDGVWSILDKKLTQTPFAMGFQIKNLDGWYGFYMPAIQVSFDDPASGGQNQDVMLDMSGVAKVGANGESAIVIYK